MLLGLGSKASMCRSRNASLSRTFQAFLLNFQTFLPGRFQGQGRLFIPVSEFHGLLLVSAPFPHPRTICILPHWWQQERPFKIASLFFSFSSFSVFPFLSPSFLHFLILLLFLSIITFISLLSFTQPVRCGIISAHKKKMCKLYDTCRHYITQIFLHNLPLIFNLADSLVHAGLYRFMWKVLLPSPWLTSKGPRNTVSSNINSQRSKKKTCYCVGWRLLKRVPLLGPTSS